MATRNGSRRTKTEQWLFGGRWRGTVKETRHAVASEDKPPNPAMVQKDEDICLEKSRVHLPGLGQREIIDIAPGRKSMPEMEINMKEVVAVLGVKVMAADMPPFMQLHAFRCAKRSHDSLDKFSSRQVAHDVKKVSSVQILIFCLLYLLEKSLSSYL
jgi:dynein light chain LC8-type